GTERRTIKQAVPHLVLTTPEMLHAGILAYHGGWRAFFQELRYVILPDVHLYVDALGAHMAHLCRRLQRLASHYGAQPQYLLTSAPLAQMENLVRELTAHTCAVVSGNGRAVSLQHRLILQSQGNPVELCRTLMVWHQEAGLPSVVLAPERLVGRLREAGIPQVFSHQTPFSTVQTVAAQSLICFGVPGSLSALHEYLAWLARGVLPSLSCLLLTGDTPLERYLLRYPAVYEMPWQQQLAWYPSNPDVARYHLHCAAAELALAPGERYSGIHGVGELIHQLAEAQTITRHATAGTWVAAARGPHRRATLRAYEAPIALVHALNGRLLSRWAPERVFRDTFPGAVYIDEHGAWQVEQVSAERRRVLVQPTSVDYLTRGRVQTTVTTRTMAASVSKEHWRITYGACVYSETRTAYERLDPHTQVCRSVHVLPSQQRQIATQGVWLSGIETTSLAPHATREAWHALVHAVLAALPLVLLGDTGQLQGGVWSEGAGIEALFFDTQPGGNAVSALLYHDHERLLRLALQLLAPCTCVNGCVQCVGTQRCTTCRADGAIQRQAGVALLQALLGETVPTWASVSTAKLSVPAPPAHHLYLVLSTQKSAEEVGGWQHKHLLRLGVAVTYDTQAQRYRVYSEETVGDLLASLRAADLVLGFNTRDFDYQVLQPYADVPLASLPTLAILDEVHQALGFRLSLSHLVQATLDLARGDESVQTLQWYQEGDRERIVKQCRRDLDLLKALVRYGSDTGTLWYRDHSGVRTAVPVDWQRLQRDG
ncbi:MAG: DUF1998 domain-containing protein, partial [Candidatus Tectomicrobia bacterium]|nr:DUF1998 domain-containing protein [Candidatus Tectomicrobia bacterium]